ncbi:hypothetical protein QQF64_006013 [Cirrhinus molitorella]|uniref:Uncharacterized protein n=1 Tax=Cirrhinus molitorella TaxID=172907 RepID=A0ABR3MH14_9TELE
MGPVSVSSSSEEHFLEPCEKGVPALTLRGAHPGLPCGQPEASGGTFDLGRAAVGPGNPSWSRGCQDGRSAACVSVTVA